MQQDTELVAEQLGIFSLTQLYWALMRRELFGFTQLAGTPGESGVTHPFVFRIQTWHCQTPLFSNLSSNYFRT